jgi:iron complex outermembrane receptor protein
MNKKLHQTKLMQKMLLWLLALLPMASQVYAQQGTAVVTGIIKSENGEVVRGVAVKAENAATRFSALATTNDKGLFTFTALPAGGPYTFIITSIGYATDTLTGYTAKENGRISLSVILKMKAQNLDNIVVVGYGKTSRAAITGAVTSVQSEEFNQGVLASPAQLLQGKVAGLNITKSGNPNESAAVILRGPSTLRSGAAQEPFYVIDGIPGASIDLVAPDDITSIDVLKDASSAAIYGSRAANGVIMITTRKAKAGQSRLAYNSYVAMEKVSNRIEMLTGDELRKYLKDNGTALNASDDQAGANTDWQNEVMRTGVSHNHNVALSGGTGKTNYTASVNYFRNEGIMKTSSLERVIMRVGIEQMAINDRLKLNLSVSNSNSNQQNIAGQVFENMLNYLPTVPVKQPNGTYTEDYLRGSYLNPVSLLENNTDKTKIKVLLAHAGAELSIIKGLDFTTSLSLQNQQANRDLYRSQFSGLAQGLSGVGVRNTYEDTKKIFEAYFNYEKKAGRHGIKALAGYSWQDDRTGDGFQSSSEGFLNDDLTYYNLGLGFSKNEKYRVDYGNTGIKTLRLISFYGRINYQFDDKYLFQATVRKDGSSAFGANSRWGYFPSVSAGWRIIKEQFMQGQHLFNDLKLRAGYGISGNSLGFDPLIAQLRYGVKGTFYNGGQLSNAIGVIQNENPDLKWEKTAVANVGVDFSLLNGRISGSVDYYDKRTSDLIWDYPVPTTQYFLGTITANVGEISNKGVEVVINASPVQGRDFNWRTSFNIAHNANKVVSLSNDQFRLDSVPVAFLGGKGQSSSWSQVVKGNLPIGSFYLWQYAGKDKDGISQFTKANGTLTSGQPGTVDLMPSGNAQPKLIYGWSNSFTYKKFDLNIFVRGVYGNKVLNATLAGVSAPTDAKIYNLSKFAMNESFKDGNAFLVSSRYLESGSYLRLDNATLGYTFPSFTSAISKLRLYAAVNNLFVITDYRGVDPEINMGGLTPGIDNRNYYPKTRSFIAGVNVIF